MQKWQYKFLTRNRGWDKTDKSKAYMEALDWRGNIEKTLTELGNDGWELVCVVARSSVLGGMGSNMEVTGQNYDYAGFTNEELWVFKRPQP